MTLYRSIRPLFVCVSAIALAACSYDGYSDTPVKAPVTGNGQMAGQSQDGSGLRQMADNFAANGKCAAAIPIYRHLAAATGDPSAMLALGRCLTSQGAHEEATTVLMTLSTRGQLTGDGYYLLGKNELALGKYEEARKAFDGAWALMPGNPKVRSGRGVALAATGHVEEAIGAFSGAIDTASMSNMALVLAAAGHPTDAIGILEPLVRSGKAGVQGRQNLAMAYLMAGREADAFKLARVDLDSKTVDETFTFYRSLASLTPAHRMQALVSGSVDPSWTAQAMGNMAVADSDAQKAAAKRLVPEEKPAPQPVKKVADPPKPKPVVDRSKYELKEVPPLLEPEGWALQIAAYRTIKELMRGWTILYRRSGDLLQDVPPRRSEVDFGKRNKKPSGFYYRLNAGPLKTLQEARTLCKALKERGTDCWIRPPEKSEGKLPKASGKGAKKATTKTAADHK
ncbi:SPOR domain-containing protein [Kordiimonas marina]|uniref:SPOR domain-containing protein n=1 Tax=Kordiimonas marina TaxID=2872312 RepID=UPI001FF5AD07|nr:SPOR domain-containing protein [Kordiimonas marina]MCJ9429776.1 tetratricopeptide repeat protein [Kordiimonas marina]